MTRNLLGVLPALLLSLFVLPFTGCQAAKNVIPAPMVEALGKVTGFSSSIGEWKSQLGSMLGDTAFGQLGEYASKAKNLAGSLTGMTDGLSDAMRDPLGAITAKLGDMGDLNIDRLKQMVPGERMKRVDGFVDSAGEVGDLTKAFLDKFGD